MQESAETATVDYPMIEHLAIGKQTINLVVDGSVAESLADAPTIKDSTVGQQIAYYFGNSSATIPSTKALEAKILAVDQQTVNYFVDN